MLAGLSRLRQLGRRYRVDGRLPPPVSSLMRRRAQLRAASRIRRVSARIMPPVRTSAVDAPLARLGGRRVATCDDLPTSISRLALDQAVRVVDALDPPPGDAFVVDRNGDRIVLGIVFEQRAEAARRLADALGADGWLVRWHDGPRSGIIPVARLATHRSARRGRCWEVFRAFSWGDTAIGDAAAVVVTFWQIGTSGQREQVGVRGHRRFDERSPATIEHVDDRAFPGRTAFPVGRDMRRLADSVDVVITWVDGDDPAWAESMRTTAARVGRPIDDRALDAARFRSRDELRYVLRSIWAYCGWVRRIHLVTAGQRPGWLADHERIVLVDHGAIMPADALPTFNSHAIEASLHRIDGLSEHFVYFNDDMFVARPLRPETFFTPNGLARVFQGGAGVPGTEDAETEAVDTAARRGRELLEARFGRVVFDKPYHSPYPLRRSTLMEIEREYPEVIAATRHSRFRSPDDLSLAASFGQHYGVATGSSVFGDIENEYVNVESGRLKWHLDRIRLADDLDTFCINETRDSGGDHHQREIAIATFLQALYPVRAPWERVDA